MDVLLVVDLLPAPVEPDPVVVVQWVEVEVVLIQSLRVVPLDRLSVEDRDLPCLLSPGPPLSNDLDGGWYTPSSVVYKYIVVSTLLRRRSRSHRKFLGFWTEEILILRQFYSVLSWTDGFTGFLLCSVYISPGVIIFTILTSASSLSLSTLFVSLLVMMEGCKFRQKS